MMERLARAVDQGMLRPLDRYFALWMGRFAGTQDPALLLAAALVSWRSGQGDVCLDLPAHAGRPLFVTPEDETGLVAPKLDEWRQALGRSPVVGRPGEMAPLILDHADRLYLGRYWQLEQDLLHSLRQRLGLWAAGVDTALLQTGLQRLFPNQGQDPDRQQLAAALAVLRTFCVITGGPGTGKTRTVTAILALLLEQAKGKPPRIALAAPTGKAAARLSESIALAREQLPLSAELAAAIPTQAMTLHRLLGFRPDRVEPRHGADHPLGLEVLVVDEVSMVDLPLMSRLLAALPTKARLILLGDKDQLASVEAGMVLGDLCGRGRSGTGPDWTSLSEAMAAQPRRPSGRASIAEHILVLDKSYRFAGTSGIGALAQAVNRGESGTALALLRSGRHQDIALLEVEAQRLPEYLHRQVLPGYIPYLQAENPEAALAAFARFRVLCALRDGPFGVSGLNRLIEQGLRAKGLIRGTQAMYRGRPLLVTSNDYGQGLFNGDLGLVLTDPGSPTPRVYFATSTGTRSLLPGRLPAHETVFAMTVHKSQGSEFDEVLLVLPERDSPVLTRELIYTAITRARHRVTILGSPASLELALASRVERSSGLLEGLWGAPREPD